MPVTHFNRRRDTYYLHVGTTKTGKPRYWFSRSAEGDLAGSIPEGYEVYENPDAQVFLRKVQPQVVTPFEVAVVEKGLMRYAPGQHCIVDVQKEHIVIHHAERTFLELEYFGVRDLPDHFRDYVKVMRFTLKDKDTRMYRVQRWCFRGSVDRWIDLWMKGGDGKLSDLVEKFCPHIGQESFFELM
jgi:hypothetical protein